MQTHLIMNTSADKKPGHTDHATTDAKSSDPGRDDEEANNRTRASRPRALMPFQPSTMTPAQLAAVSYLARYTGHTHRLYDHPLRRWFARAETHALDPLLGIERAHIELYIRSLSESGLVASSVNTMMHAVLGYFGFAHIDSHIISDPAVTTRGSGLRSPA